MISVVQRVSRACVRVDGDIVADIGAGLVALVGVVREDGPEDVAFIGKRLASLRVFADSHGRMNLSLSEVNGSVLLVSQFTLAADTHKGRRPSFGRAMRPSRAEPLLESLREQLSELGLQVVTGVFGASMEVELVNDGPVTLMLDSRRRRYPADDKESEAEGSGDE